MGVFASRCFDGGQAAPAKLGKGSSKSRPVIDLNSRQRGVFQQDAPGCSSARTGGPPSISELVEPRHLSARHLGHAATGSTPCVDNPVNRLCKETEHGLAVLNRETLVSELQSFSQPVAVLYVSSVAPAAAGAYETTHSSIDRPPGLGNPSPDGDLGLAVRRSSSNGEACLVFTTEQGSIAVGCVLANTAAVRALQLKDEQQDMLHFLARSFSKDPGLKVLFQDIVKRLLQGQLSTVNHFVPGDFGRDRYFLSMRISPFAYRAPEDAGRDAVPGADADESPGSPFSTKPEADMVLRSADGGEYSGGGGGGGVTPAMILELDVPYEGKELAARLQRDYMIISHIPSIVTMFDRATGRVLHQNRSSVAYMGHMVGLDEDWSAGPATSQQQPDAGAAALYGSKRAASAAHNNCAAASPPVNRLHQLFAQDPAKLADVLLAVAEGTEWRGLVKMPPKAQWGAPSLDQETPGGTDGCGGAATAAPPGIIPVAKGSALAIRSVPLNSGVSEVSDLAAGLAAGALRSMPSHTASPSEPRRVAADLLRELQASVLSPASASGARVRASAYGGRPPGPRSSVGFQPQPPPRAADDGAACLSSAAARRPISLLAAGSMRRSSVAGTVAEAAMASLAMTSSRRMSAEPTYGRQPAAQLAATDAADSAAASQPTSTSVCPTAAPVSDGDAQGHPAAQASGAPGDRPASSSPQRKALGASDTVLAASKGGQLAAGDSDVGTHSARVDARGSVNARRASGHRQLQPPTEASALRPAATQPVYGSSGSGCAVVAAASLAAWGSPAASQRSGCTTEAGTAHASSGREEPPRASGRDLLYPTVSGGSGFGIRVAGGDSVDPGSPSVAVNPDQQGSGTWGQPEGPDDAGDLAGGEVASSGGKHTLLDTRNSTSGGLSDVIAANLSIEFMPHHLRPGSVLLWGRGSSTLSRANTHGQLGAPQALAYIDEERAGGDDAEELSFLLPKVGPRPAGGLAAAATARLPRAVPPQRRSRPNAPPAGQSAFARVGSDSDQLPCASASPGRRAGSAADEEAPSLDKLGDDAPRNSLRASPAAPATPTTPVPSVLLESGAAAEALQGGARAASACGPAQAAATFARASAPDMPAGPDASAAPDRHDRPPACGRSRSSHLAADAAPAAALDIPVRSRRSALGAAAAPSLPLPPLAHAHSVPTGRATTYLQHTSEGHGRRLHTVLRALINSGAHVSGSSAGSAAPPRLGTAAGGAAAGGTAPASLSNGSDGALRHVQSLPAPNSFSSAALPKANGLQGAGAGGGAPTHGTGVLARRSTVPSLAAGESRALPAALEPRQLVGGGTADAAAEVECRWHEVHVKPCFDPMSSQPLVMVIQTDVTSKVRAELQLARVLEAEHRLLADIFPRHVVHYMTQRRKDEAELERNGLMMLRSIQDPAALATSHESITVLFADIKGFTEMSKEVPPAAVMTFLNDLYTRFDSLTDVYGVYKVETIGDCYMVAGGLVARDGDGYGRAVRCGGDTDPLAAQRVVAFARAMLEEARRVALPNTGEPVQVRVGIHSGPVVSGVVGQKMPRFCLFGDTINTASRMESTGRPGAVHISALTRGLLPPEEDEEGWAPTGGVEVKGKGRMDTYMWCPQSVTAGRQRRDKQRQAMLLGTLSSLPGSSTVSPSASAWARRPAGPPSGAAALGSDNRPSGVSSAATAFDATTTML